MIEMIGDSCSEKEERVDVMVYMVFPTRLLISFCGWDPMLFYISFYRRFVFFVSEFDGRSRMKGSLVLVSAAR